MKSDLHITTCICHHTLVGDDYTATTVVVTFMSGDGPGATLNVSIPIVDDSLVEGPVPESFIVELVVGGSSDNGTVRIFDNDGKSLHDLNKGLSLRPFLKCCMCNFGTRVFIMS